MYADLSAYCLYVYLLLLLVLLMLLLGAHYCTYQ